METLEQKIARVVAEHVDVVPYDPAWPGRFAAERDHLLACLPRELVRRIEHFGSTAVPGLAAKPIVDMLVEVTSLEETERRIAPLLEAQGYDHFWRPTTSDDGPPFYAWFIKRDAAGARTHHIHMVEAHFEHWDRLLFRDYLVLHPDVAREYGRLKQGLAQQHAGDRVAYTAAKTAFVTAVTARAKAHFAAEATMTLAAIEAEIRALEESLLAPATRADRARLEALLAPDFVEIAASGRAWSRSEIVESLTREPGDVARTLHDLRVRRVAPGVVLALFRVVASAPAAPASSSLRSSLWIQTGDGWRLVFHQGTRSADSA